MQLTDLKDISALLAASIAATTTLLAVIVTSLFNIKVAKINIEAQNKQKAKELKLQKLEELFFFFDKWQVNFSNIYLNHLRCYRGKLTYGETLKLINENNFLAPGEAQKYKMLMEIHFPTLLHEYAPVESARKSIVPFLDDPRVSKLDSNAFEKCQVDFEQACTAFKTKMSSLANLELNK